METDQQDAHEIDHLLNSQSEEAVRSDDKMDESNSEWEKAVEENVAWRDIWSLVLIFFIAQGIYSEIGLLYTYFDQNIMRAFWTTLGVLVGTYLLVLIISFFWLYPEYKQPNRPCQHWLAPILSHIFGLALLFRELEVVYLSHLVRHLTTFSNDGDEKKSDFKLNKYKETKRSKNKDVAWLNVICAAFKSAPKMALQLYLALATPFDFRDPLDEILRLSLLIFSWVPFSVSFATLHSALQEPDEEKTHILVILFFKFFTVGPRFFLLAVFASLYHYWIVLPLGVHWLIMFLILLCNQKQFCCSWECICSLGLAWIHLFDFLSCHKKCSAFITGTFYFLTGLQNVVFIALCHKHPIVQDNLNQLGLTVSPGLIFVGVKVAWIVGLLVYCTFSFEKWDRLSQSRTTKNPASDVISAQNA